MGHEQTALLLSERVVKEKLHERRRHSWVIGERERETKGGFKDTAPRYGGWRNRRQTTTGASRRSELRGF